MSARRILTALCALLERELRRVLRIWVQTLLPPAITTALYFVIFGELIGAQLADIGGHRYMDYIAPGLVLMAVITNAYANVVASFYSAKFQRHIEEMLVAPVPNWLLLAGFIGGGMARGLGVGLAVTAVAACFTPVAPVHLGLTLLVAALTCVLFSLAGLINGVYANSFDDIAIIPNFVLTPLTYLGGIFFSLEMLPPFWQQVSLFNPILHMVGLFRYGWMDLREVDPGLSLLLLAALTAALFLFCMHLLRRGTGVRS